jgi:SMC interacting uncharacterized protein involved in chromosome segregation
LADPVTGYQPAHILNLDLRGQVKASFSSLRKEISERRTVAMDEMMKHHDLLDGIKEAIEDKRGEVEALEHRVRAAEEEYEKTKEVRVSRLCFQTPTDELIGHHNSEARLRYSNREDGERAGQDASRSH